ncbi:uncharacterized protein LOC118753527 [Rhagoletis pomonella]|uniref:uncharacterized protein LOC118753527 n=1 Tax=Rhagoletis pomonella TaxID=28610 RepID=UPI001782EA0B|nr:uncharacterized protein LOC118753527 [Rhagoletis pomonella]
MSAVGSNKSLADYSCFLVHKAILAISKEITSITSLRDGSILLLVKNNAIASRFLKTTSLPGVCQIECKLHSTLNHVKGTVYAPCLNNVDEKEIVSELSTQGVVGAYKFLKTVEGKSFPCGVVLLTFDLYNLPTKIDISWHSVKIREYIPNQMRCKACQILGHTAKHCKNSPSCVICNLPPHSPAQCTRISCANSQEQHPASAKECKKFLQAKEILKIKTTKKCTMREARRLAGSLTNNNTIEQSYSSITTRQTNNLVKDSTYTLPEPASNDENTSSTQSNIPTRNCSHHSPKSQPNNINTKYNVDEIKQHKANKDNDNKITHNYSFTKHNNNCAPQSASEASQHITTLNQQQDEQHESFTSPYNSPLPSIFAHNSNTTNTEGINSDISLTPLPAELQHLAPFLNSLNSTPYGNIEKKN